MRTWLFPLSLFVLVCVSALAEELPLCNNTYPADVWCKDPFTPCGAITLEGGCPLLPSCSGKTGDQPHLGPFKCKDYDPPMSPPQGYCVENDNPYDLKDCVTTQSCKWVNGKCIKAADCSTSYTMHFMMNRECDSGTTGG